MIATATKKNMRHSATAASQRYGQKFRQARPTEAFMVYDKRDHQYLCTVSAADASKACQSAFDLNQSRGRKPDQMEAHSVAAMRREAEIKTKLRGLIQQGMEEYHDGLDLGRVLAKTIARAREIPLT